MRYATSIEDAVGGTRLWARGTLPTPHLLDATWWFDAGTVCTYCSRLAELPSHTTVVCLGTPTIFLAAISHSLLPEVRLFDRDEMICCHLPRTAKERFSCVDLAKQIPAKVNADWVIADAPWYDFDLRCFLVAAQAVARLGATVELSIPPIETRPGIIEEREALFSWAREGGLTLLHIKPSAVRYDTPLFEKNALKAAGANVAPDWRVGDLAVLKVERASGLHLPIRELHRVWQEVRLLDTRWRIGEQSTIASGDSRLIKMGWTDDIFPSCSRRHPLRQVVDVWTSGNRTFKCLDSEALLQTARELRGKNLEEVRAKANPLRLSKNSIVSETAAQLLHIIEIEQQEIEALRSHA
jgi:hypothetical protein